MSTGPTALPKFRRQRPDQRRRVLMDATLQCLATHGVEKTSVRTICETAGVSIGLVNHYYASKEALIADVYRQLADDLLDTLKTRVAATAGDARTRLIAFIRASFAPDTLDPGLLRVWLAFWTMTLSTPAIAAVHTRTYADYRRFLEHLLGELAAECAFPRLTVRQAAIGLNGLLDGLWVEWCLNPETFTPDEGIALCTVWLDGLIAG